MWYNVTRDTMYFGRGVLKFQRNLPPPSSGHCEYTFTKMCGVTWQETKLFIVTTVKVMVKIKVTL